MKMNRFSVMLLIATVGCRQEPAAENEANPPPNEVTVAPAPVARPAAPVPEERTPLAEPQGPIDPKSVEAAGQVVQHYGALIEQGRWTESWKLWSDPEAAKAFDRNWRDATEVHLEIGELGDTEGAAGSIYTTVPAVFYGKTKGGESFRRPARVILRRVNDVPGSTDAQRRWHIERIDVR